MRLAADASAIVAEALRARGEWLLQHDDLDLLIAPPIWSEVVHEIGRRLDSMVTQGRMTLARRGEAEVTIIESLAQQLSLVPASAYTGYEAEARDRIPRDPNDWPTVALALSLGIGIWTSDRDFFGCGVPVWTTQTLLTHLTAGRGRQ